MIAANAAVQLRENGHSSFAEHARPADVRVADFVAVRRNCKKSMQQLACFASRCERQAFEMGPNKHQSTVFAIRSSHLSSALEEAVVCLSVNVWSVLLSLSTIAFR